MVSSIETHETAQRNLMDSFIQLIAQAIDEKSPYTASHCARVPELALMLAAQASDSSALPFKDFGLKHRTSGASTRSQPGCTTAARSPRRSTLSTRGASLKPFTIAFMKFVCGLKCCGAMQKFTIGNSSRNNLTWSLICEPRCRQTVKNCLIDFGFIAQCNVGGETFDDEKTIPP